MKAIISSVLLGLLSLAMAQQEVVIGWSGAATGPTSDAGRFIFEAVQDYCAFINQEDLIPGHQLRCIVRDDAYNNDNTLRNFESALDEGIVAFIGYATGSTLQLKLNTAEEEIPLLGASLHIETIEPPDNEFMFLPITSYSEQVLGLMEWIADNHEGDEPARIAILSHPSPFGRAPVEDARAAADLLGVTIVEVQEHGDATDYTAMLQRWNNSGVGYVITQTVQSPVAAMLNAAEALGLKDNMMFMGAHYTGGATLTNLAGESAEGFLWATSFLLETEDTPGMAVQRQVGEQASRSEESIQDVNYTTGLLHVEIYAEAIRRLSAQGRSVDNIGIHETLLAMNDDMDGAFDSGFAVGSVSFSEEDRVGVNMMRLIQVQDGEWLPVSEPFASETFRQVRPAR